MANARTVNPEKRRIMTPLHVRAAAKVRNDTASFEGCRMKRFTIEHAGCAARWVIRRAKSLSDGRSMIPCATATVAPSAKMLATMVENVCLLSAADGLQCLQEEI
jgi:hypothetical protein